MKLKIEAARRQLGLATELFLNDKDPVSVHTLAHAAGDILEFYAAKVELDFFSHALAANTHLSRKQLRDTQRQFANALKHASIDQKRRVERDDEDLLNEFTDRENDAALFIGWGDYAMAVGSLPVEAQIFHAWYFARDPDQLVIQPENFGRLFPGLKGATRDVQKQMLRDKIEWARAIAEIMLDPKTDPRPLVLGWPPI